MSPIPGPDQIERVRDLLGQRTGLTFDDDRRGDMARAIDERVRAVGGGDFTTWWNRLSSPSEGAAEVAALAGLLTVGETSFFRIRGHMEALVEVAARRLERPGGAPLRILSAGCSSGEEAFSIAMLLLGLDADPRRLEIVGVDIDPWALEKASEALYSDWSLRETPAAVRSRFFRPEGRRHRLCDEVRAVVRFRPHNLMEVGDVFLPERWDVIFCRNVLIYLSDEARERLIRQCSAALAPGGFLFLGHAETLRGLSHDFTLLHSHDSFYYRRKAEAAAEPLPRFPASSVTGPLPQIEMDMERPLDVSWVEAIERASDRIAGLIEAAPPRFPAAIPAPMAGEAASAPASRLEEVRELVRLERFNDAVEVLGRAPGAAVDPDALILLAVAEVNRGRIDEAEAACGRILDLDQMNAEAHYIMALCREHRRDVPAAVRHDEFALYLDPGFAMARFHLGMMTRRSGDLAAARRQLGEALRMMARENSARILMFGGGFSREALMRLCRSELQTCGGGG
jgi:chemotaxis protein methyltransferase CheR